jgi:hypothetical protein
MAWHGRSIGLASFVKIGHYQLWCAFLRPSEVSVIAVRMTRKTVQDLETNRANQVTFPCPCMHGHTHNQALAASPSCSKASPLPDEARITPSKREGKENRKDGIADLPSGPLDLLQSPRLPNHRVSLQRHANYIKPVHWLHTPRSALKTAQVTPQASHSSAFRSSHQAGVNSGARSTT